MADAVRYIPVIPFFSEPTMDERDDQISRLKKKVGELTMDNELLHEKVQRLEENFPLARRRSR